jgi:ribosomal protein S18 acetylase RimI-like enzyme
MAVTFNQIGSTSDPQNAKRYVDAYLRLFNDPENLKFLSFTGIPFARETVEAWLRDADASGIEYQTAVGDDGRICAIMVTAANPIEGFEIMSIVVEAGCRRAGVGGRLIDMAVHKAKEKGFRSVSVAVFADNKRMLSLVIRNDFRPYKIECRARWDGEDVVRLKKYLH